MGDIETNQSCPKLKKIKDSISPEHLEFLAYCSDSGKVYVSDLTNMDYVAFRASYGKSKEYVRELRLEMQNRVCKDDDVDIDISDTAKATENLLPIDKDSVQNIDDKAVSKGFEIKSATKTLAKRFKVNPSNFSTISIDVLNLSVRPTKCLEYVHCKTLEELLLMSKENLQSIRNMGETSVKEVTKALKIYISKHQVKTSAKIGTTLADVFKVRATDFETINFEVLNLNVRSTHCLQSVNCKSIADILLLSEEDLQNIRNMGKKTKNEIIQAIGEYISNHNGTSYVETDYGRMDSETITLTPPLKSAIESLLRNEQYDIDCLSKRQKDDFMKIKNAVDEIGVEICQTAYDNPHYNEHICNMLWKFSSQFTRYEKIKEKASYLPEDIQQLSVLPFIETYERKSKEDLSWLASRCLPETQLQNLLGFIGVEPDNDDCSSKLDALDKFIAWMNFDIIETANTIWQKFLDGIKNERTRSIFLMRAEGKTLEEIGKEFNLTRERVRQIEKRTFTAFWQQYNNQDHDVVMMVYALNEGKDTISFEDLQDIAGDFALILWKCLKHDQNHDDYYYSKMMDMIVIRHENGKNLSDNALMNLKLKFQKEMPPILEISQKENVLSNFMERNTMSSITSSALVERLFESQYKKSGNFYHRGRITVTYMCEYVLKHRFQNGFKIADDFEAERFRQYMRELFGDNISMSLT